MQQRTTSSSEKRALARRCSSAAWGTLTSFGGYAPEPTPGHCSLRAPLPRISQRRHPSHVRTQGSGPTHGRRSARYGGRPRHTVEGRCRPTQAARGGLRAVPGGVPIWHSARLSATRLPKEHALDSRARMVAKARWRVLADQRYRAARLSHQRQLDTAPPQCPRVARCLRQPCAMAAHAQAGPQREQSRAHLPMSDLSGL